MTLKLFFTFFLIVLYASAENSTCSEKVYQSLNKKKAISRADFQYQINSNSEYNYTVKCVFDMCEAEVAMKTLKSNSFSSLCPGIASKKRLDCVKNLISSTNIDTTVKLTNFMLLLLAATSLDKINFSSEKNFLIVDFLETSINLIERTNPKQFYVNNLKNSQELVKLEMDVYKKAKKDLTSLIEKQLKKDDSTIKRLPASTSLKVEQLRSRIQKIKATL